MGLTLWLAMAQTCRDKFHIAGLPANGFGIGTSLLRCMQAPNRSTMHLWQPHLRGFCHFGGNWVDFILGVNQESNGFPDPSPTIPSEHQFHCQTRCHSAAGPCTVTLTVWLWCSLQVYINLTNPNLCEYKRYISLEAFLSLSCFRESLRTQWSPSVNNNLPICSKIPAPVRCGRWALVRWKQLRGSSSICCRSFLSPVRPRSYV